jgi:V8-like Glu-specific endopeptidase
VYPKTTNGVVDTTVYFSAVEAHIPFNYFTDSNDEYDYALIKLGTNLTGSEYPHFNLGMPYNIYSNSDFEDYTIYVSGYPDVTPIGPNDPPRQLYTGEGNISMDENVCQNLFKFTTDINYGTSGGPVYIKERYRNYNNDEYTTINTVVSICSGIYTIYTYPFNAGPIMNPMMIKFYLNNYYLN